MPRVERYNFNQQEMQHYHKMIQILSGFNRGKLRAFMDEGIMLDLLEDMAKDVTDL